MTSGPDHPLLHLLRRIETDAANIRKWSSYWAEYNLLPILHDIRAAMDQPDLKVEDLHRFVSPLQAALQQRDDTKALADLADLPGPPKAAEDYGPPLPGHVPLDKRIPNEIKTAADRVIEGIRPAPSPPATAPTPPSGTPGAST